MKLSRAESQAHKTAVQLLAKEGQLSQAERDAIAERYHEGATSDNVALSAFFTPDDMAAHLALNVPGNARVLDLCAGIGSLARAITNDYHPPRELVLVELNPEYCAVAKRLLPSAEIICGSMYDEVLMAELASRSFDIVVSNPPFGRISKPEGARGPRYKGETHFEAIDIASDLAAMGVFIIPQQACPFAYSGRRDYQVVENAKYEAFRKATGIEINLGLSIDTSVLSPFRGTKITVEIVECDFRRALAEREPEQSDLFAIAA